METALRMIRNSIAESPKATRELFVIVGIGLIFMFIIYFDIFFNYGSWLQQRGLKEWVASDVLYILVYFGFAFALFAYHRWQDTQAEMIGRLKAERLKDEFLSMASHELRTPMTTIREGVSQVADGLHGDTTPEQAEYLQIALGEIDRMTGIINDLLDISKIEAGKFEIRRDNEDMVRIAGRAARVFGPSAAAKGLKIKTVFSRPSVEAYVDRDRMTQVWGNLLNNAMKFTESGCVELSVTDFEDQALCHVKDTGRGIPPEELQNVFSKFYQLSGVRGRTERGTGLGLTIAKAIVELHGGTMSVESTLGEGSTFSFVIPKIHPAEEL